MQALVAAALARFTAAAGPPPTTEPLKEEDQRRRSDEAQDAMEQDEEPEFVGAKEAREVGPQELGVADKAGPKTGEVETCRHWAKGCCMQVDACRYAHPQPRVPRGVPQDLLLILQAMARVGALSLDRSQSLSRSHGTLLREVVAKAQGGGLPPVGYAAMDPEVLLLGDREGPGLRMGQGLEVRTARLPSPVDRDILEGL